MKKCLGLLTLPIQITLPFHYIISFTCCIYFIFSSLLPAFNYVIIILLPFLVICYPFKLFVTKFLKRTLTLTPILTPTLILKNSIIFTKIFIYIIYIIYFSTNLYKSKSAKQSQSRLISNHKISYVQSTTHVMEDFSTPSRTYNAFFLYTSFSI